MSPTALSLQLLRQEGYLVDIVERWLPHANKRADLFRMFDVLGIRADLPGTLGIQTTSATNHASRVKKLLGNATLRVWLASGNGAEVWSWSKDNRGRWTCRKASLTLADADGVAVSEEPRPRRRRKRETQPDLDFGAIAGEK